MAPIQTRAMEIQVTLTAQVEGADAAVKAVAAMAAQSAQEHRANVILG